MTKTIAGCLTDLDITNAAVFADCDNTDEEFKVMKKRWRTKVLAEHPDKGGDPAKFRITNAAFEVLRDLYQQSIVQDGTFTSYLTDFAKAQAAEMDIDIDELFTKYSKNSNVPSWEFFAAAAEEDVPGYKVELARSARSKCVVCKENKKKTAIVDANAAPAESSTAIVAAAASTLSSSQPKNDAACIDKDDLRVGSLDKDAGSYGRWHHLECWRVPKKVHQGLTNPTDEEASLRDLLSMDEVLLTGLGALGKEHQIAFVRHAINSDHWAGTRKRKAVAARAQGEAKAAKSESASKAAKGKKKSSSGTAANNIIPGSFRVLVPGVDGAVEDDSFLKGKTFVMTGVFPEVGGGEPIGVESLKSMIQSFGGKVMTRFSKNTNFLLAGNNPVAKRFTDATAKSIEIINLVRLKGLLEGQLTFDRLDKLDAFDSDEFKGDAYQPATNESVEFGDAKSAAAKKGSKKPAALKKEAKKPAAVNTDEVPPLASDSEPMAEDSKPALVLSIGAAAATAIVARADTEGGVSTNTAIVTVNGKTRFNMPKPGKNGAIAGVFDGQTFVLTGVFPEVGGGTGLVMGKDKIKTMIQNFGGRVTGSVSGKTTFLVVGKDPGASKVSKASSKEIPLVDLLALNRAIHGHSTLEDISREPAPRITNFSGGYRGNSLLKNAAEAEW